MMPRLVATSVLVMMLAAGCGDSPPASPAPPAAGGDTITGRERFGWAQQAASATELATFRYAVYVDGIRRVLDGVACATVSSAAGFECSAPLPSLTAGRHTLELAAFITDDGGAVVEGARSEPLHVTVAGATAEAPTVRDGTFTTPDGLTLDAAVLAHDLVDPVDLAITADRRVYVAERAGRIRVFGEGTEATDDNVLDLFRRVEEAELLSIALAPDFQQTELLHVALLAVDGDEPSLYFARVRAAGGLMAEAAILSSHPVPQEATARIRFGPDRHLYAGIGTGVSPEEAQSLTAVAGKILRLRDDGRTPEDNPWSSPVWSVGHRDPRGLAWHPGDQTLWAVERDEDGDEINSIRSGANYGWPTIRGAQAHQHVTRPAVVLPAGTDVSGITTVQVPASPLYGDLIVSAERGQDLLRIRLDRGRRQRPTSSLLQGRFGEIGQVASGPDGALYLITATAQALGSGTDMLIRLTPTASSVTRPPAR